MPPEGFLLLCYSRLSHIQPILASKYTGEPFSEHKSTGAVLGVSDKVASYLGLDGGFRGVPQFPVLKYMCNWLVTMI